jgi:hypothetical protein
LGEEMAGAIKGDAASRSRIGLSEDGTDLSVCWASWLRMVESGNSGGGALLVRGLCCLDGWVVAVRLWV